MTEQEVEATARPIVDQLSKCFGVPCPEVQAQGEIELHESALGLYTSDPVFDEDDLFAAHPRIFLRIDCFTIDIVLHEFAHHLQRLKDPDGTVGSLSHGKEFFEELYRIASHYYGNPELYEWEWTVCPEKPETLKHFYKRTATPPLADLLRERYPELFEEYARACKKVMVPCRLCNPHAADTAGAGR